MHVNDREWLYPCSALSGRFEIESVLGKGAFGRVYKAVELETGKLIAFKVVFE